MSDNRRWYIPNQNIKTSDGVNLSITMPSHEVYCEHPGSGALMRVDSLWLKKIRVLSICLPNGRQCRLVDKGGGKFLERH